MSEWIIDKLPDSDLTVLIRCSGSEFPVWPGFHDGEEWRSATGETLEGPVSGWLELEDAAAKLDGAQLLKDVPEKEVLAVSGIPCVVCGSCLTLGVRRAVPVVMVHCNTCGSEVPYHVTQKLSLWRVRGLTATASSPNDRDQV